MMLITMQMILKILFISDFLLGILNVKNVRHLLKKGLNEELMLIGWNPWRWWNFYMPEDKIKRNRTNFYCIMHLMHQKYTIWKYWNILVRKIMQRTWYGSILLCDILGQNVSKYILENILNNSAHKDLI